MSRAEDMALMNRLQLVHQLNEDLRVGRDPYPRLKREIEFWESSENLLKGGAEELFFLDSVLRTLVAIRPAPSFGRGWLRRLEEPPRARNLQAA